MTLYCCTHNWLCVQKILNHNLNHGFFILLFKLISCTIHWIVCLLAYLYKFHESMSFIWIVWSTLYVYLWKRGRKKGKSSKVECKKCHFNSVLSVSFAKYRQFWNISPFSHILWSQFVYYGKTSNGKRSHLQMVILAISNFAIICKWNS